ncbi:hypothetical protein [Candidatus Enterococcus mansonii]|uniref:Uncharacterized protein n=1 Tax=Candidatus Enterococcus mansonii TaxID=1834181 RepID=A0A242CF15_9ENTE|nr:hypothetical protein [Enterococcus sp. 4G2_DIV0659]OTO08510.1 hypothetical protein A5880_001510 [Enterococcus sp. 4G2_DIV0659]
MTKPKICNDDEKQPAVPEFCGSGAWEVPVNHLSEIKQPNRDHAYILPDDSVWVLAYDGKRFTPINSGEGGGNTRPTQLTNTDTYLDVSGNGTYNITANLNTENVIELVKEKIDIPNIVLETVGVVKPDGTTITMDEHGVITSVFPEPPSDGYAYARQEGKWVKHFVYPNVYYEFDNLADNQLTFSIAVKDEVENYNVLFNEVEVPLSKRSTCITGQVQFDRTSTQREKTAVQFYMIKDGIEELFYTLDLKPLFKLLNTHTGGSSTYVDKSEAVTFDETEYFSIESKQIIKQDKTVFFNVNLTSEQAFSFSRNKKIKIGKLSDPELFPTSRIAVNMVTESENTAIYANTALIIETNGDLMLVNTSDVSIGSAYNFKVGNVHFINMTYVIL